MGTEDAEPEDACLVCLSKRFVMLALGVAPGDRPLLSLRLALSLGVTEPDGALTPKLLCFLDEGLSSRGLSFEPPDDSGCCLETRAPALSNSNSSDVRFLALRGAKALGGDDGCSADSKSTGASSSDGEGNGDSSCDSSLSTGIGCLDTSTWLDLRG